MTDQNQESFVPTIDKETALSSLTSEELEKLEKYAGSSISLSRADSVTSLSDNFKHACYYLIQDLERIVEALRDEDVPSLDNALSIFATTYSFKASGDIFKSIIDHALQASLLEEDSQNLGGMTINSATGAGFNPFAIPTAPTTGTGTSAPAVKKGSPFLELLVQYGYIDTDLYFSEIDNVVKRNAYGAEVVENGRLVTEKVIKKQYLGDILLTSNSTPLLEFALEGPLPFYDVANKESRIQAFKFLFDTNNLELLNKMIDAGFDLNQNETARNRPLIMDLLYSADDDSLEALILIHSKGLKLDVHDEMDFSPYARMVYRGMIKSVEWANGLSEQEIDVFSRNALGETPLDIALKSPQRVVESQDDWDYKKSRLEERQAKNKEEEDKLGLKNTDPFALELALGERPVDYPVGMDNLVRAAIAVMDETKTAFYQRKMEAIEKKDVFIGEAANLEFGEIDGLGF